MRAKKSIYGDYMFFKKKKLFIAAIFLNVFVTTMNVYVAIILEKLINLATVDTNINDLLMYIGKMLIYLFLLSIFCYSSYKLKNKYMYKVMREYKDHIFNMIIEKKISNFGEHQSSVYVSGLSNDINIIETDYLKGLFKSIEEVTYLAGGIITMIYINIFVFIGIIVLFIIPVGVTAIFGNKLEAQQNKVSELSGKFIACIQDVFAGFSDIKLFKAEKQILNVYKINNNNFEMTKKNRNDVEEKITLFSTVSGSLFIIGVCTICVYLAIKNIITVGAVVACIQCVNYIVKPIQELPPIVSKMNAAKKIIEKLEKITESQNMSNLLEDNFKGFENHIKMENVAFGYEKDKDIIKDINVVFEKGKSYAIVGASGSGKSTLLSLIMGFSEKYKGNITIDGKEIKDICNDNLYKYISIIQQKVFVFNSSVRDNITMYNNFDKDTITQAIQIAGLKEFIKEKGLEYDCGENGCNLSGGERQRISIARSILQRKPILIMDEATAALDAKTSFEVENTILDMKDVTRIVVTHKLNKNILEKYDEILVIKNGEIVEKGTYNGLMQRRENFFALNLVSSV